MFKRITLLVVIFILTISLTAAHAQTSDACAAMNQHWSDQMGYAIGQPHIRYEANNQRVVIWEDNQLKIVQVVEANFASNSFYGVFSPDCRFMVATTADKKQRQLIAWDLPGGSRISAVDETSRVMQFSWSPAGNALVVQTYADAHLWDLAANKWLFLTNDGDYGSFYSYLTWDFARNQLLAVPGNIGHAVYAYSLTTGEPLAIYESGSDAAPVTYKLSDDGSRIAVFTDDLDRIYDGRPSGLSVWDRNTGVRFSLNSQERMIGQESQVVFSPDNRYLVVARNTIRIWDLQNLRKDGLPNTEYEGPVARIGIIRFIDANTIETQTAAYCRSECNLYWLCWDFSTGKFLNAYDAKHELIVKDFVLPTKKAL